VRRPLVLLALAVAVFGVLGRSASANVGPAPVPTRSLPGALVWGTGVFTSRASFERWLRDHRESLTAWTKLHPRATAILVAAEAGPVRFLPSQFAPHGSAPLEEPAEQPVSNHASLPIVAILAALSLALVVLAALPFPVFAPRWGPGAVVYHNRLPLLVSGMTLLVAIVVSKLAA
jgi:hypothetical protein